MNNVDSSAWREAWHQTKQSLEAHRRFIWLSSIFILVAMLFPSDLDSYRSNPPLQSVSGWITQMTDMPNDLIQSKLQDGVNWVEDHGRFIATGAQVLVPLVMFDKVGGAQLLYLSLATTTATHTFKRLFNNVEVAGTPIGQRPKGGRHNVPSGHSSMAASALGFLWRRYGVFHVYYLLPLVLATMATRVFLSAHTLSAVIAGALLGFVMAYVMTTPRKPKQE